MSSADLTATGTNDHPRVLLADKDLGNGSAAAGTLGALCEELSSMGMSVAPARTQAEIDLVLGARPEVGAALIEWEPDGLRALLALIDRLRSDNEALPILLLSKDSKVTEIPIELAEGTTGFFWLGEDTPEFVAGRVHRLVHRDSGRHDISPSPALESAPFFSALKRYTDDFNWSWSCPGHQGGTFYRKTPLGREFFDFVGENFLRADLCNASVELGSLLQHEGPIHDAEERAAEVFGSERTYFVLNGTSTSNKMVTLGLLSPGDLVLFDRNCHKSMHHGALMLAGATPIYLNPTRGASGIIGPIDHESLEEDHIREQIRLHPLVGDPEAWRQKRPFRLAILTNTTYDGVCYNARELLEKLGGLCDYVVFDEAWMAYAKFHPLYRGRFGMDLTDLSAEDPGIYTTQSTHKCLAGLSQASQIHVRDSHLAGQFRQLEHERFNEVYMMHTSTSPQYNIIASLDVGAQIMRGQEGVALIDDAIRESVALRKQIARYESDIAAREPAAPSSWFFGVFGPRTVEVSVGELEEAIAEPRIPAAAKETLKAAVADGGLENVPMTDVHDDILASVPACWTFKASDQWHDLRGIAPGYVMLDPTKCTITMPGISEDGSFSERGIPAAIPAAVLRARGMVSEKTSFYTMLVLITAAIEKGKSGTLLAELLRIKNEYDEGTPLDKVLPDLVDAHPGRYGGLRFSDLCTEMHDFLRDARADVLQQAAFSAEHQPAIAMGPSAAHAELIAGRVELVPLEALANRIAATLIVPYPPGIAIMVPGERFGADSALVEYLQLFEDNDNRFPGFTSEIQGVFARQDTGGQMRYHTYVLKETG